jgi:N-acetylglucosaminyldiphosphoundecaprenol N-acetyl-beta-D-mannosaminyltransferase
MDTDIECKELFGMPIHAATMEQAVGMCVNAIERSQGLVIGVVNAAKLVNMQREPVLRDSVLDSDVILADGIAVVWASRLLGRGLPERVAGIDLFQRLLEAANERKYSVYFLGAAQEVLDEVLQRTREEYPHVRIAGSHNGYFDAERDSERIANDIKKAAPDMLFLGMTSPKKEVFLSKWGRKINVAVCHGVGGSFDVMAGKVKRAPRLWQRLGLEWLYRVVQEPRRMWRRYLVTNTLFMGMLVREMLRPTPLLRRDARA